MAEDGSGWTYIWDGMKMKREGYREAMSFIFDGSRAVSFQENDMRPLAEWIGLWTEDAPDGDTSAAAAVQGDTSAGRKLRQISKTENDGQRAVGNYDPPMAPGPFCLLTANVSCVQKWHTITDCCILRQYILFTNALN